MRTNILIRGAVALACMLTVVVGQLAVTPWQVPAAHAQSARDEAKRHFVEGKRLHDSGDYRGAIREYQAAEQLAPSPLNDYNIGLANDRLGEKAEAARHYRAYVDRMPNAKDRDTVLARAAELEAAVAADGAAARAEEARKSEEARKAEEARLAAEAGKQPPPVDTAPPYTAPPDTTPPAGPPAGPITSTPSTGDPELDRAAGVDVAAIRDGRAGAPPAAGTGEGIHANFGEPPPLAGGEDPAAGGLAVTETPKPKPIYKQWWFWVVVGVSAYILIDIATNNDPNDSQAAVLPGGPRAAGPTVFSF